LFCIFPPHQTGRKISALIFWAEFVFIDFLSFFIEFSFPLTRLTSAYDPDGFPFLSMGNHKESILCRYAEGDVSLFISQFSRGKFERWLKRLVRWLSAQFHRENLAKSQHH
jgi:hypothetical protein